MRDDQLIRLLEDLGRSVREDPNEVVVPSTDAIVAYCLGNASAEEARLVRAAIARSAQVFEEVWRTREALGVDAESFSVVSSPEISESPDSNEMLVFPILHLKALTPAVRRPLALAAAAEERPVPESETIRAKGVEILLRISSAGELIAILERERERQAIGGAMIFIEEVGLHGEIVRRATGSTDLRGQVILGSVEEFPAPAPDTFYRAAILLPPRQAAR